MMCAKDPLVSKCSHQSSEDGKNYFVFRNIDKRIKIILRTIYVRQYLSMFISFAPFTSPRNDFTASWSVAGFFFPCISSYNGY
jgi:hypothetical protein